MSGERTVTITDADVRFVEQAKRHYEAFAEGAEIQGEERVAGIMRKQAFYAERFLLRLTTAVSEADVGQARMTDIWSLLGIPPMGEQEVQLDFASAIGALRARRRVDPRKGGPTDEQTARSLERLWEKLSALSRTPLAALPAEEPSR